MKRSVLDPLGGAKRGKGGGDDGSNEDSDSTDSSDSSGARQRFRPRWDFGPVERQRCRPGVILQTAYHTGAAPALALGCRAPAGNLTETARGFVFTKYRRFIVLEAHATHVQAVPVYTHNNTGLDRKRGLEREYVCVRDRDVGQGGGGGGPAAAPEEGVNGTLFGRRKPGFHADFVGGRAVAKLTEAVSFSTAGGGLAAARVEGRLEDESLRRLARLVHDARARSLADVLEGPADGGREQRRGGEDEDPGLAEVKRQNNELRTQLLRHQIIERRLKRRLELLEAALVPSGQQQAPKAEQCRRHSWSDLER